MIQATRDNSPPGEGVRISVVLPLFNEAAVLEELVSRLEDCFAGRDEDFELVFVNDGSTDDSAAVLNQLAADNPRIRVVHFSRNFGHQAAVQAGLLHASGDAIVVMDTDLQDDPAAIPAFLDRWHDGYDVVYATRFARKENLLKRFLFFTFYRVLNAISKTPLPKDAGNFGLIDRRVAQRIAHLIDRDRFFPGLRRWVGFRQIGVPVERLARHDEKPRVSMRGLWRLAKTAVFSFSDFPLTMFYSIAAISFIVCAALFGFTLYHKLLAGSATPGWTSTLMTASFFGSLNALGIAVLGEYVIRIYDQVRSRPQFIVAEKLNFDDTADQTVAASLDWQSSPWADASDSTFGGGLQDLPHRPR